MTVKLLTENHLEFLNLKGVYTCINATYLEISCRGSYTYERKLAFSVRMYALWWSQTSQTFRIRDLSVLEYSHKEETLKIAQVSKQKQKYLKNFNPDTTGIIQYFDCIFTLKHIINYPPGDQHSIKVDSILIQLVSMTRKYHNHTIQTNPQHRKENTRTITATRYQKGNQNKANSFAFPSEMTAKLERAQCFAQQINGPNTKSPQTIGAWEQQLKQRIHINRTTALERTAAEATVSGGH